MQSFSDLSGLRPKNPHLGVYGPGCMILLPSPAVSPDAQNGRHPGPTRLLGMVTGGDGRI